jgi:hypothetical protein
MVRYPPLGASWNAKKELVLLLFSNTNGGEERARGAGTTTVHEGDDT